MKTDKPFQNFFETLKNWVLAFDYSAEDYVFDRMKYADSNIETLEKRVADLENVKLNTEECTS